MADPLATVGDVESVWRPLSASETTVADRMIRIASRVIRTRFSDVDSRIAADALSADDVADVVASMVKRAMMAPDTEGLKSFAEGAGPFSRNFQYSNPDGNVYLTAEEKLLFEPEAASPRVRMGWLA